jgi:hypothetical protein
MLNAQTSSGIVAKASASTEPGRGGRGRDALDRFFADVDQRLYPTFLIVEHQPEWVERQAAARSSCCQQEVTKCTGRQG